MSRRSLYAAIALGALALGILTERSVFNPPRSILMWLAIAVVPDEWGNAGIIVVSALVAVLFAGWCTPLLKGRVRLSAVAYVLPSVVAILSACLFAFSWEHGVRYQGLGTVRLVMAVNAVTTLAVIGIVYHNRRRPGTATGFAFRWLLLAWFVTTAFPWLGESI